MYTTSTPVASKARQGLKLSELEAEDIPEAYFDCNGMEVGPDFAQLPRKWNHVPGLRLICSCRCCVLDKAPPLPRRHPAALVAAVDTINLDATQNGLMGEADCDISQRQGQRMQQGTLNAESESDESERCTPAFHAQSGK